MLTDEDNIEIGNKRIAIKFFRSVLHKDKELWKKYLTVLTVSEAEIIAASALIEAGYIDSSEATKAVVGAYDAYIKAFQRAGIAENMRLHLANARAPEGPAPT